MRIALLGLGRMGQAIAHRLNADHELTVWNRSKGKTDELVAAGAIEAETPLGAVGGVDVVITVLSNDGAVRELVLGSDGIHRSLGPQLYVDMSTISPSLSAELDASCDRFVALPVLGAPQAVRNGEATYLAGGSEALVNELAPLLSSLGGHYKHYGHPQLAASAKLAVNLMLLSGVVSLAESFTVARAGGLTEEELTDLLIDSPMIATGLKNRFDAIREGSGPLWWTIALAMKDAGLAVDLVANGGSQLHLGKTVLELYTAAVARGLGDCDMAAVAQLYPS